MKFSTYEPTVNPNVMHNVPVHASRDLHVYGPQVVDPGNSAQWKALGQLALVGLEMNKKVTDGKVMQANNEYNRLMSEGTMALMQRKEENALNITDDYDKLQQRVLGEVRKKYGDFIGAGPGAEAFNNYTERDNITRREHMMKYQMAETERFHDTQYNNQLASCQQMVMDGGATDAAIEEGFNRGIGLLTSHFANYGPEKVREQARLFKGQLVASALQLAVNMGDYARIGEISGKYGSLLDPKTRITALSMLGKRQREAHDLRQANDMLSQLGRYATWEDMKNAVIEEMANKKGAAGLLNYGDSLVGKTMRNGRVGCAEAYIEITAPFLKFSAENQGETWVPNIYRAALQSSNVTVERFNGQQIPPGSGIIYVDAGDDPNDPEMLSHITVADGVGGYIGNSSSARDYEDENGETVRGDGCIVHAGSQDIDGLEIAWIIKPNDLAAAELSDLQIEEETNRRYALYQKKVNEIIASENRLIKQGRLEMQDLMNQGVMDLDQYRDVVNRYAIQDGVVNDNIRIPLETLLATEERRQDRAAAQAARHQPSGKVDPTLENYLIKAISTGGVKSANEIISFCNDAGITDPKEISKCTKLFDDYLENKGIFKISKDDFKTIEAYIPELEGVKGQAKAQMVSTIHTLSYLEAKKYMAQHDGEMPEEVELAGLVSKAFTENVVTGARTMENSFFGNWFGTPITISRADLAANGYVNCKYLGDGRYMLQKLNGAEWDYKNEEEVLAMMGRSGYVKP